MKNRWYWLLGSANGGVLVLCMLVCHLRQQTSATPSAEDNWCSSELHRSELLEAQMQELFSRSAARRHVVEELLAGRLTWAQAAEHFAALNHRSPECKTALRLRYVGVSDEECARHSQG
jgi:hypothetical protein